MEKAGALTGQLIWMVQYLYWPIRIEEGWEEQMFG
jgi:hypothetical protein